MFQWRLKIREARQALAAGRVDEARRLLDDKQLRAFLPAKQLAGEVASKIAERARQRIAWGESGAAFDDLRAAEQLGGGLPTADAIRHEYATGAAQQATARLVAGEPEAAAQRLERARRRGVSSDQLRAVTEIAARWVEARQSVAAGEMARAESLLAGVERLATAYESGQPGDPLGLAGLGSAKMTLVGRVAEEAAELAERAKQHHAARDRLHAAAAARQWDEALSAVEETLRLAPADPVAMGLRRRLWKEVGLGLTRSHHGRPQPTPLAMPRQRARDDSPGHKGRELAQSLRDDPEARRSTRPPQSTKDDTSAGAPAADRRMLWVDAVGGYLVCLDSEIVLGQPTGSANAPAAPILADISRRHAVLRREAGSYVLEPLGPVWLDGRRVTGPTVLADTHTIELSSSDADAAPRGAVRINFTRPHALSATARLEIASRHRTAPSADGLLLMAESCVLGPGAHSHVHCPRWKEDVILFRQADRLLCRSNAPVEVDGAAAAGPVEIGAGTRIEGEDFALSVELA